MTQEFELRKEARALLQALIPEFVSVTAAARLLDVSRQTIYTWIGDSNFGLPMFGQVKIIIDFANLAAGVRKSAEEFTVWSQVNNLDGSFSRAIIHPQALSILKSHEPHDEKVRKLTRLTLAVIAKGVK